MIASHITMLPCVAFAGVMSLSVSCNSAPGAPAGATPAARLKQLAAFYGQVCAGSIFGARLGFAASEALKNRGATGEFRARYYELCCPVEGTRPGREGSFGCHGPTARDRGEHRLVLTSETDSCAVEARLTSKAQELGLGSRDLVRRITALPSDSPERLLLEREVEEIHAWLGTAPTDEVVLITAREEKGNGTPARRR
jgi:formylmethanofuran dehydrogenase subunit E